MTWVKMVRWQRVLAAVLAWIGGVLIAYFVLGVPLAEMHLASGLVATVGVTAIIFDIGDRIFGRGGDND